MTFMPHPIARFRPPLFFPIWKDHTLAPPVICEMESSRGFQSPNPGIKRHQKALDATYRLDKYRRVIQAIGKEFECTERAIRALELSEFEFLQILAESVFPSPQKEVVIMLAYAFFTVSVFDDEGRCTRPMSESEADRNGRVQAAPFVYVSIGFAKLPNWQIAEDKLCSELFNEMKNVDRSSFARYL